MTFVHARRASTLVIAVVALTSSLITTSATAGDTTACATNFTAKGNFLKGKKFDTWQEFPAVSTTDAFKRVYAAVLKEGWTIGVADKDLGAISASQEVSFSEGGKAVPMNILVEEVPGGGSKVSMTFSLTGGVMGGTKTVQEGFCKFMAAVDV